MAETKIVKGTIESKSQRYVKMGWGVYAVTKIVKGTIESKSQQLTETENKVLR